jgi:hypothetical protein
MKSPLVLPGQQLRPAEVHDQKARKGRAREGCRENSADPPEYTPARSDGRAGGLACRPGRKIHHRAGLHVGGAGHGSGPALANPAGATRSNLQQTVSNSAVAVPAYVGRKALAAALFNSTENRIRPRNPHGPFSWGIRFLRVNEEAASSCTRKRRTVRGRCDPGRVPARGRGITCVGLM